MKTIQEVEKYQVISEKPCIKERRTFYQEEEAVAHAREMNKCGFTVTIKVISHLLDWWED